MWGYRTCRVAGVRALRALRALVRPSHPHVGLLFRAWATPPTYGTGGPRAGEGVQPYTRLAAMRASPLCGAWAFSSARGPAIPSLGNPARVRDRRPACGIGGPRAKEGVQPYTRLAAMRASSLCGAWAFSSARGPAVPSLGNPAHVRDRRPACERRGAALHQARCNARKLAMWSLGLLIRTWACCSESGQPRPCTGQAARVRNRRPACGTRWSPSCFVQVPVGGGPPARSPHASLRLGVVDLEARPGPAAAPGHRFCPLAPISSRASSSRSV